MTREEAIAIIRKEYLCVDRDCDIERSCGKCDLVMPSKEPILEAYKMAIKALEQESSGDTISRDAVLDYIHRILNQGTGKKKSFEFIRKYVEKLPPVKPQKSRTELKYCDRNICMATEYNGIGCDECEVTKSQEPTDENLHREREQAYMQGYEDASKRFRQEPCEDVISRQAVLDLIADYDLSMGQVVRGIHALPSVKPQEPKTGQYEKHIDHTDCIWYGSDSGCPVTCSQYRDGWNDAMDYIFKNGKGYQPYRHDG